MTLYDYLNLMENGEEVSVTDRDYNIANIYFYANHNPSDKFCVEINNEYYGAAEPPVRCGESHLSGLTEPPHFVY